MGENQQLQIKELMKEIQSFKANQQKMTAELSKCRKENDGYKCKLERYEKIIYGPDIHEKVAAAKKRNRNSKTSRLRNKSLNGF